MRRAPLGDYWALTKPNIMLLLLFTGAVGMVSAARGVPPLERGAVSLLGLALSTGGAAAFNMWYDRDIDGKMTRTRSRPLPQGRVPAWHALAMALSMEIAALAVFLIWVGGLAAALSLAGFVYYAAVYTCWLKRSTPQNIVVGGGAGAMPPLIGWAAITGHLAWTPLWLFLLIFLWTPPHFWALALYRASDYEKAGIPMMPNVKGPQATKRQAFVYILCLIAASFGVYLGDFLRPIYLVAAGAMGTSFVAYGLRLIGEPESDTAWARRTFRYSLLYLPMLFLAIALSLKPQ